MPGHFDMFKSFLRPGRRSEAQANEAVSGASSPGRAGGPPVRQREGRRLPPLGPGMDPWTLQRSDRAHGATELMAAARAGNADAVNALLAGHAIVDQRDDHGRSALSYAAAGGHQEIMESLIASGSDVHQQDLGLQTPLMVSAQKGHAAGARTLIDHGAAVDQADAAGGTALTYAARGGKPTVARVLIAAGADVNHRERTTGRTPLMEAASRAHSTTVDLLLRHGADPRLKDASGRSAFEMLADAPRRPHFTPLIQAAQSGNEEQLRSSMRQGWLNERDLNGRTALMHAAANGHVGCVRRLLDAKADLGAVDDEGLSAMALAASAGHAECVRLMAVAGANIN